MWWLINPILHNIQFPYCKFLFVLITRLGHSSWPEISTNSHFQDSRLQGRKSVVDAIGQIISTQTYSQWKDADMKQSILHRSPALSSRGSLALVWKFTGGKLTKYLRFHISGRVLSQETSLKSLSHMFSFIKNYILWARFTSVKSYILMNHDGEQS